MIFDNEQQASTTGASVIRNRRHIPPPSAKGAKPAGYWFKHHGCEESTGDRRTATTTGQMLYQIIDPRPPSVALPTNSPPTPPSPSALAANRRRQTYNNRLSEHDNRNIIQNYGEYFGRGFGKRLTPHSVRDTNGWIFSHDLYPLPPSRSTTQRDYRGLPALDKRQLASSIIPSSTSQKSSGHWMKSCYDDWGENIERIPNELIYRNDYKRMPVHPWQY